MNVPLCHLLSMLIVQVALKINVLKMEHVFKMGYQKGEKTFYVCLTNWKGKEEEVTHHDNTWNPFWWEKNVRFEAFLKEDLDIS